MKCPECGCPCAARRSELATLCDCPDCGATFRTKRMRSKKRRAAEGAATDKYLAFLDALDKKSDTDDIITCESRQSSMYGDRLAFAWRITRTEQEW